MTYALQVVQGMQLRTQTTVNAEELLVHDCCQWQCAEGLHACLVDILGVLVLALKLESKVVGQMTALVVTTEQP